MGKYQETLEELKTRELLDEIREPLKKHSDELHAERVIDKMLMFVGMSLWSERHPQNGPYGKAWYPPNDSALKFSEEVVDTFKDSPLIKQLNLLKLP